MKIIDAHLHLFPREPRIDQTAQQVGHENSVEHLSQVYPKLNMVHGVVMTNRTLAEEAHNYPTDLFHYCIGLDSWVLGRGESIPKDLPDQVECHLKRESCCGVKLYPGYNKLWLTDPIYEPIYQLAQTYGKPVAVHMGLTAYAKAHLKYSHPMALDEVAADHPKVSFVMCHFGNPFLQEAAAVLEKNPNVSTDLSGLLEGPLDLARYQQERGAYLNCLKGWLAYVGCWDRVMYGTDWPIVNLESYLDYVKILVPEEHWAQVLFHSANRIYQLGL